MFCGLEDLSGNPERQTMGPSPEETMCVEAARALPDGATVFVGIGLPSTAANLARQSHAPNLVLVYESGTIGAKPDVLPMSIGDAELALTADSVVSIPDIFAHWLQAGRIDIGFLGGAQIDRFANINTTVIGTYEHPRVRLPGAGGAPEIAAHAGEVFVIMRHTPRAFVERVDFITTPGFLTGGNARAQAGFRGRGPTRVITDLGVLEPHPLSCELTLTALHPGVTVRTAQDATGWPLRISTDLRTTGEITTEELEVLRALQRRTQLYSG